MSVNSNHVSSSHPSNQFLQKKVTHFSKKIIEVNQNRQIHAQEIEKSIWIYAIYGVLDGLSLSCSMVRYGFDILYTSTTNILASDQMHEWMLTFNGIAIVAAQSIIIITCSLLANIYSCSDSEKSSDSLQSMIDASWSYCRDAMKGLKNAYKGTRSVVQIISFFSGLDLRQMIVPIGVVMGLFSIINRMFIRQLKETRKSFMKKNASLCTQAMEKKSIAQLDALVSTIDELFAGQLVGISRTSLYASAYGGFIDGLYLFMGVLGVSSSLAPPVVILLAVLSVSYTLICMATRTFEEQEFQNKLIQSQRKLQLLISGKKIQQYVEEISEKVIRLGLHQYDDILENERRQLVLSLEAETIQFKKQLELFNQLPRMTSLQAALSGLRDGLVAYSSISSLAVSIITLYSLFFTPISPALVIATVITGFVCLLMFMAYAVVYNEICQETGEHQVKSELGNLLQTLETIKGSIDTFEKDKVTLQVKHVKNTAQATIGNLLLEPVTPLLFPEWFEVIRSFFSGVTKGQKAVDFVCNPLQEKDDDGHYRDNKLMVAMTGIVAVIYSFSLAARAYVKGFSKLDIQIKEKGEWSSVEQHEDNNFSVSKQEVSDSNRQKQNKENNQSISNQGMDVPTKPPEPDGDKPSSPSPRTPPLRYFSLFNNRSKALTSCGDDNPKTYGL
ncbi:MAG: hypothetical protein ACOVQX_02960 [Legionella sp.]